VDFELSGDQEALQKAVRKLCAGAFPMATVRSLETHAGVDRDLWRRLADAGVFSLRLTEAAGGAGLGSCEAVLVFEELGRALVPGPLLWTHLAAGFMDGAATGQLVVGGVERRVGQDGQAPTMVEHLAAVDRLLVLDEAGVWEVEPAAVEGEPVQHPLDPLTPLHAVRRLSPGARLAGPETAADCRLEGATLAAALLLGLAAAVTDMAVAYAKEREQFERPIGSFQAVKHLLADMLVRTEVARAAVYAAGVHLDDPDIGDVERAVAGAKLMAGEAALANGKTCIQVHGGMGFTWEVDAHLYLKRARVLDTVFGPVDTQAEVMAEFIGGIAAPGGAPSPPSS
jgi:alkylation response protein AidB-like acyl-CoA dehydrogenase